MPVKRHIKPGRVEPSSDGRAIVVHFTTVTTQLDEDGSPGSVEKAPGSLEIPVADSLEGIGPEGVPALAREIVERCKYIPATKTQQVEQLLEKLRAAAPGGSVRHHHVPPPDTEAASDTGSRRPHRSVPSSQCSPTTPRVPKADRHDTRPGDAGERPPGRGDGNRTGALLAPPGGPSEPADAAGKSTQSSRSSQRPKPGRARGRLVDILPRASIGEMDEYAEDLYEESTDLKAAAARRLLRLCLEPSELSAVAENSSVLGALSRELRENAKRSHELAAAITGVFLCLAHFTHFHRSLAHHQVPEASLRVLEYEAKRRLALQKEHRQAQKQVADRGDGAGPEASKALRREEKWHQDVMERLDRVTLLCLLLLRDLCQDTRVEASLVRQNLCRLLPPLLARPGEELLLATLGFLHKLCVCEPNKDTLLQSSDALAHLAELTAHSSATVASLALRLCYNLAFDPLGREKLAAQTALLGKLPAVAQQPATRKGAVRLLYNLSVDRQLRGLFASRHEGCIVLAMQMLDQRQQAAHGARAGASPEPRASPERLGGRPSRSALEAVALCVNLAADPACAARMLEERELFSKVAHRAIRDADAVQLKVVRNAAAHAASRPKFLGVMSEGPHGDPGWLTGLLRLAESCNDNLDVLVEVLGIFAALDCASPAVPWPELCAAGLLDLLHRHLTLGFTEGDVLLEVVQIAGALAADPACAAALAGSRVPQDVPALLLEQGRDADLMVQLLFALRCLLLRDECCDLVLRGPVAAAKAAMDAARIARQGLQPQAAQAVQVAADGVLELILARESEGGREKQWTNRIREFRFEAHNEPWCQRLRGGAPDAAPPAGRAPHASPRKASPRKSAAARSGAAWAGAGSLAERVWQAADAAE
ncbi:unnamed protein product, partial [Prorocentrum cordatum]